MHQDVDRTVLIRAVKHPANYKPIIFCSISLVAVGMLMVVFGIVIMLLDHVELGPPHYDSQYERYVGSSLPHLVGPMFIAFGSFIVMGNLFMLAYATASYYSNLNNNNTTLRSNPVSKRRQNHYVQA